MSAVNSTSPTAHGVPNATAGRLPLQRLLNVSFRPDIQWTKLDVQQRWVARDPLNGRFFYFNQWERHAAVLLNGARSLDDIYSELQRQFPNSVIDRSWLLNLISRFSASQLLLPETAQSVDLLLHKHRQAEQRSWMQLILSPMSIRIPILNPHAWLVSLKPLATILFAKLTIAVVIVVACLANVSVLAKLIVNPAALTLDISLLQGDRWMWLLICYVTVKSLHELGHGLACIHCGTKCSELGLLFLFFTPCLYCDTTDAWKLKSRWHRAAIGAAGMYVELILATCAALIWQCTQDGLLHSLAANVMLICSVGTVLVNGNPFMRYDGYYIFSDLWGVPNLADQAREASVLALQRILTGQPVSAGHLDRSVWALATYHFLAFAYRTFILVMILWLAWTMLVPIGLGFLAVIIIAGTVLGVGLATFRMGKQVYLQVVANAALKSIRLVAFFVCLFLAVYFVCQVQLPVYVNTRGLTEFSDKRPIFAADNATLVNSVALGKQVVPGTQLIEFDTPDKQYELQLVQNDISLLSKKIQFLNQAASFNTSASFELPVAEKLLSDRRARAQILEQDLALLNPTTEQTGHLIPANIKLREPLAAPKDLPWNSGPLDEMSRGCLVERGTLLGWFSNQQQMEVVAIVSQQGIKHLRLGMIAACRWDSDVSQIVQGKIIRIAPDPIEQTPEELVGDPSLVSMRNSVGQFAPSEPHYAVTIRIDRPIPQRIKGALVTVQIHVYSQPLIQTLIHAARVNFKSN